MASKRDDYKDMLGMMPDADIAEMAGVAASTVRGWRNQLDIAAFDGEPDDGPQDGDDLGGVDTADEKPVFVAPKVPAKAPGAVRALANKRIPGPTGRTLRVDFRGIYRGEVAAFLWREHPDLVEPFPPRE